MSSVVSTPVRSQRVTKHPWHLRRIRGIIYAALIVALVSIAVSSVLDTPGLSQALVEAREIYGLFALGLLMAAMIPGPLNFVLPWVPFRGHLVLGRRALGVSAFIFAL